MTITIIRAIIIYFFVSASVRIMGKRQVGELNPQELVITILISAVATVPLEDNGMPLANSLIPIAIFIAFEILTSALSMKSLKFRNLIQGKPIFIIKDGEIKQNELKRLRYTVDDLIDGIRQAGVFDISQVANAVVETNGSISVQTKSEYSPLTPKVAGIKTEPAEIPITVIMDGKEVEEYYSNITCSKNSIKVLAVINGVQSENVLLMNTDSNGNVYIVKKEESK
ncbi:DUF421 domain-containing protein [uncultured Eubacterium sp.]|uniref:DUF421 domain-containing protein n=1 Tax=uncultured Eubacterium sp. TaxID=165185 RepID=UPI0015B0BD5D|nr:DUF421 domain-containing protein [uncultured Eubacterium sp.]